MLLRKLSHQQQDEQEASPSTSHGLMLPPEEEKEKPLVAVTSQDYDNGSQASFRGSASVLEIMSCSEDEEKLVVLPTDTPPATDNAMTKLLRNEKNTTRPSKATDFRGKVSPFEAPGECQEVNDITLSEDDESDTHSINNKSDESIVLNEPAGFDSNVVLEAYGDTATTPIRYIHLLRDELKVSEEDPKAIRNTNKINFDKASETKKSGITMTLINEAFSAKKATDNSVNSGANNNNDEEMHDGQPPNEPTVYSDHLETESEPDPGKLTQ